MEQQIPGELAEKGVLAGLFDTPDDVHLVSAILQPEDFSEPRNSVVYQTILNAAQQGENTDPITIASKLEEQAELKNIGGVEYLVSLINTNEIHAYDVDVLGYAAIVRKRSQRRQILSLSQRLHALSANDSGYTTDEIMGLAENEIRKVTDLIVQSEAEHVKDALSGVLESIEERGNIPEGSTLGVPSGFADLDNLTTGWKPGQFIILAARPAQGKTTAALDFARTSAIKAGMTTLFFSLEMGKEELIEKVLSAEARIDSSRIKKGELNPDEWESLRVAAKKLENSNLIIDASPGTNIPHIRAVAQRQKASPEGLDLIILDYLQLLSSGQRVESRQQEVSEFSRSLKLLAKEFEVPVIALSQLNRASEQRTDKTPLPSDMRESGSLEQDADIVLLLHRPESYDPDDRPGLAILNLAKHRGGPTAEINLISMLHYSKFVNSSGIMPPPPASEEPDLEPTPPPPPETAPEPTYAPPVDDSQPWDTTPDYAPPPPAW